MAKRLVSSTDLKTLFNEFPDLAALVGKINDEITDINQKNVKAGGGDEIGKQYHEKIDNPMANLTTLLTQIRVKLLAAGLHGTSTVKLFDDIDEHNRNLV
ncbi:hypothetical protein [Kitasatospora sp. NBC_01300]|uniref:hypothetical protein n=1 Tax=Kitasatospora sp. NBC_01300 TaxID=2903574 RepID=UPI00352D29A8|nr:hypothetical protein OG556_31085 [Kitasatospora sp. NBC_01300]